MKESHHSTPQVRSTHVVSRKSVLKQTSKSDSFDSVATQE